MGNRAYTRDCAGCGAARQPQKMPSHLSCKAGTRVEVSIRGDLCVGNPVVGTRDHRVRDEK